MIWEPKVEGLCLVRVLLLLDNVAEGRSRAEQVCLPLSFFLRKPTSSPAWGPPWYLRTSQRPHL